MNGLDPLFRNMGTLALTPLNADGATEEGAEGDAATALLALSCGLDPSLVGDSEHHKGPTTPDLSPLLGGPPRGVCGRDGLVLRHLGSWHETLERIGREKGRESKFSGKGEMG